VSQMGRRVRLIFGLLRYLVFSAVPSLFLPNKGFRIVWKSIQLETRNSMHFLLRFSSSSFTCLVRCILAFVTFCDFFYCNATGNCVEKSCLHLHRVDISYLPYSPRFEPVMRQTRPTKCTCPMPPPRPSWRIETYLCNKQSQMPHGGDC